MINIEVDQEKLKELYLQKIDEHLQESESDLLFMNLKQLATYLNMSWNTIVTHLLYEEEFPKIRLGSKRLFHKKEVG
jgi:lipopolysaccharide biosynthesis glycosyltransferase